METNFRGTLNMKNTLSESAVRVLEGAAFLFTDDLNPENTPRDISAWSPIVTSLHYEGPNVGFCELWLSQSMAKTVAQNMLGLESLDDVTEQKMHDAAKEMLNMVLGNFLTDAFGVDDVYGLGIPQLESKSALPVETDPFIHVWLDVEGEPILFRLKNLSKVG